MDQGAGRDLSSGAYYQFRSKMKNEKFQSLRIGEIDITETMWDTATRTGLLRLPSPSVQFGINNEIGNQPGTFDRVLCEFETGGHSCYAYLVKEGNQTGLRFEKDDLFEVRSQMALLCGTRIVIWAHTAGNIRRWAIYSELWEDETRLLHLLLDLNAPYPRYRE